LAKHRAKPRGCENYGRGGVRGHSSPCCFYPAVELVVSGTFKSLVFPSGLIFMGWGWLSDPAGTGGWFQVLSQHFRSSHEVGSGQGSEQVCGRVLGLLTRSFLFFCSLFVKNKSKK